MLHAVLFFIFYTFYQANRYAYYARYYPKPSPEDFIKRRKAAPSPSTTPSDSISTTPKTTTTNNNANRAYVEEHCFEQDRECEMNSHQDIDLFNNSQKYNVDLHNDPSKYILLSSLFKTLDNAEICKFFASQHKHSTTIQWSDVYHRSSSSSHSVLYVLTYHDGGYTYNLVEQILSEILGVSYEMLDIHHMVHIDKQLPNIRDSDKVLLLLRDPFEAISLHFWLYASMKSSRALNDDALEPLANFWCTADMFDAVSVRNEAKKWKAMMEFVVNEYLPQFGRDNILMIKVEDIILQPDADSLDEDALLNILEVYFKIANFVYAGDERKLNENKFSWITKIICALESNKQLIGALKLAMQDEVLPNDKMNCDIWSIVQNYAALYQYLPSTYDCI